MTLSKPISSFAPLFVFLAFYVAGITVGESVLSKELLHSLPYLLGITALGIALMFNRWRFVSPVVITLIAYAYIRSELQISLEEAENLSRFVGLNFLYCSMLVVIAVLPEKGAFSRTGIGYCLVLLFLPAYLFYAYGDLIDWGGILSVINVGEIGLSLPHWLSDELLLLHCFTGLFLLVLALVKNQAAEKSIWLTWLCGFIVCYDFARPEVSSIAFTALSITLLVIYQASSYEVTYKDALTGISGRRALEEYLSTLGSQYTIAMLDVDHFKKFNDTYGHDIGDQVLRMVASKVAKVEGGGRAYRYGGEEFTIVFNRKNVDEVGVFLEAVRESIQNYQMSLRSQARAANKKEGKKMRGTAEAGVEKVSVTISIGAANSQRGLGPSDVVKKADGLLYEAKKAGRNCLVKEKLMS